ncbi:RIP metalloprotease RseP [Aequorivita sublithincola DSM 14238]|uniref:Zinc metalloprotease n=1 Tax=Aequorivita sublithincola (strain DSM 14238 / LMG 21431 / ACAM 643 / 9-3) TaxID=746697 RepID=I3YUU9_AEQSU|nr:RIP metalloprotease RseP [Aequorivita sublithincola]AFL80767.1 RIP metalloprotease RseP [Aequorivita sublithincola DSM 14238]
MSPFAVKAIQLLLSLSLLIVLHELGHFIPAKIFKTRVEKFYLFFDVKFSLFKKKIGETVYGIGWLPLGGYVKISGMIDESMDKEQMAQPPQPWEFRSKPAWQRLIIMLGGVTVNILVGLFIYICLFYSNGQKILTNENLPNGFSVSQDFKKLGFQDGDYVLQVNGKDFKNVDRINHDIFLRDVKTITVKHQNGEDAIIALPENTAMDLFKKGEREPFSPMRQAIIDTILPEYPAANSALKVGDKILAINGEPVKSFRGMSEMVNDNKNQEIELTIQRNDEEKTVVLTADENGKLGINNLAREYNNSFQQIDYTFVESIGGGINFGYNVLVDYISQFKFLFTSEGATQVGGFGAIGNLFPDVWDWHSFWSTTAFISIMLAFMNILPIPALDGGHVMFLLYEIVTGRKPNDKFMEYAQMVGFFILIALVLFANGNDIYRWLFE